MNKRLLSLCSVGLLAIGCFPVSAFSESIAEAILEAPIVEESQETTTTSKEETDQTITSSTEETEISSETTASTTETTETTTNSEEAQTETSTEATPPSAVNPIPAVAETIPETPVLHTPEDRSDFLTTAGTKTKDVEEFILGIGEQARKIGQKHDLFASIMLAQAILESGSGTSQLSQAPHYNLFGIKGEYDGKKVVFSTYEDSEEGYYKIDAAFCSYPSYEESFTDYAELLKEGVAWNPAIYEAAWKNNADTYQNAAKALTGTYATDRAYGEKLIRLIETYELDLYDKEKSETLEATSITASGVVSTDTGSSKLTFPAYDQVNYDSGNRYAAGNCTQYVYNRITQLGGRIDLDMGNGNQWASTGRARSYAVSATPKVGTAACFQRGVLAAHPVYGHVAFVERVDQEGSVLLSEMNVLGIGIVSFRTLTANEAAKLTYITPK